MKSIKKCKICGSEYYHSPWDEIDEQCQSCQKKELGTSEVEEVEIVEVTEVSKNPFSHKKAIRNRKSDAPVTKRTPRTQRLINPANLLIFLDVILNGIVISVFISSYIRIFSRGLSLANILIFVIVTMVALHFLHVILHLLYTLFDIGRMFGKIGKKPITLAIIKFDWQRKVFGFLAFRLLAVISYLFVMGYCIAKVLGGDLDYQDIFLFLFFYSLIFELSRELLRLRWITSPNWARFNSGSKRLRAIMSILVVSLASSSYFYSVHIEKRKELQKIQFEHQRIEEGLANIYKQVSTSNSKMPFYGVNGVELDMNREEVINLGRTWESSDAYENFYIEKELGIQVKYDHNGDIFYIGKSLSSKQLKEQFAEFDATDSFVVHGIIYTRYIGENTVALTTDRERLGLGQYILMDRDKYTKYISFEIEYLSAILSLTKKFLVHHPQNEIDSETPYFETKKGGNGWFAYGNRGHELRNGRPLIGVMDNRYGRYRVIINPYTSFEEHLFLYLFTVEDLFKVLKIYFPSADGEIKVRENGPKRIISWRLDRLVYDQARPHYIVMDMFPEEKQSFISVLPSSEYHDLFDNN